MKEFKTQLIDTPGVIERVSNLFKGDSVLISGFNTFLPIGYSIECNTIDNRIKVITPSGTTTISDSESFHLKHPTDPKETGDGGPLEINHAINYVHKIKNCFTDRPEIYKEFLEILQNYQKGGKPIHKVYEQVKILLNGSTELLDEFKQFLPEPKLRKKRHGNTTLTIAKRSKHYHTKEEIETSDVRSGRRMDYAWPNFSTEEADFFDKVKSFVDNQLTYGEFLKVLDLFNSHRMDQSTLISRVEGFIGSNQDLMEIFKTLIGYDETNKQEIKPSLDTSDCGPTYRYTPKRLQNNKCSGRDALCWDVLNDTFVSHPTWANEIRTSVACKKNQYEEALDRVEEERYDYDLNIEANLNTVALLEPIAKKISQMTVDEKTNFKLSPDFASTSKTVFLRTLKKIYGSNKGSEMINLLNTNPSQSIPVVLKRLKQKDAEWKRAQREWNKIWREVESKNYWKSLDHQGVLFKLSDRKTLTTQSFVIQAELDEQFQFGFQDKAIFKDVSRLVYFFLESQPIYTREDCLSMRRFMNTIIPAMFDVNDVEPSLMTVDDIGLEEVDDDEFDDKSSVQSLDSVLSNQQNKRRALEIQGKRTSRRNRFERVGLLKNVLMRNTSRIQSSSSEGEDADDEEEQDQVRSEVSSEDQEQRRTHQEETEEEKEEEEEEDDDNEAIEEEKESSMEPDNERMLYQALYDRLHKMKKLDEEFEKDQRKSKQACKEALDLGITPRRFKTLKMDTKKGYYNVLLALIDKLLEGEVDQQTFEESVRYIFGSDAYVLFTIDKLVLLLVRHIL
ncbi:hypothetical protein G6F56_006949 [Rhizopus delemar]|nr:hypothetical protein G6F56_006949 [Rhizopus delemar]